MRAYIHKYNFEAVESYTCRQESHRLCSVRKLRITFFDCGRRARAKQARSRSRRGRQTVGWRGFIATFVVVVVVVAWESVRTYSIHCPAPSLPPSLGVRYIDRATLALNAQSPDGKNHSSASRVASGGSRVRADRNRASGGRTSRQNGYSIW